VREYEKEIMRNRKEKKTKNNNKKVFMNQNFKINGTHFSSSIL
jgi:hypothetical protein